MHAFDSSMQLQYYSSPEAIIEGYYPVRLDGYYRRKERQLAILSAEELKLRNQSKFVSEIYSGKIDLVSSGRPVPSEVMNQNLRARGYSPQAEIDSIVAKYLPLNRSSSEAEDYSYLLSLPIRSLTLERADALQNRALQTQSDLQTLRALTPEGIWLAELQILNERLIQLDPSFQRKGDTSLI
jgi:DNA topoisomerase II